MAATHTVVLSDLPTGDRGVDKTVALMMWFIRKGGSHPVVAHVASGIDRSSRRAALQGAFDAVLRHVRYKLDPDDEELVRAPWITLKGSEGDCDCMTVALGALCRALKIPCWVKVIDWRPGVGEFTHVYLMAEIKPGIAIPLDPVMGRAGFGSERWPVKRHKEYKV